MRLLLYLADMFIDTFGITRPTEKARKQAAFFILALIVVMLLGVSAIGYLVHIAMK